MSRFCWSLVLALLLHTSAFAGPEPSTDLPTDTGPWVVRAYFSSKEQLNLLTRRSAPWEVRHDQSYAVVEVPTRFEYSRLLAEGFRVAIDPDLTAFARNPLGSLRSVPGYGCYRTVEETFDSMDGLVAAHPTLASIVDIGDSWNKIHHPGTGYDLRVLKLSNSSIDGAKPRAFIMGAIHAREYATAETLMRFAEGLLARYDTDADVHWMLDHHELYLLPQANPDGRKKAELGQLWRKNLNEDYCGATSSSRGADLNRNFSFEWGAHNGSSGVGCDETYRGASAGSEPEAAAVIDFLRSIFADVRPPDLQIPAPTDASGVFLDVHSYGRLVMWPWGFTNAAPPNGPAMAALGRRLGWFNGYTPQQAVDLYVTDGGTKDFVYGDLGVPGMSFEIGTQFFQSCASFETPELQDNLNALEYLLRTARRPYLEPSGPSVRDLLSSPVEAGENISVIATADDGEFQQGNGVEPVQNITQLALYLDQFPWDVLATPDALGTVVDGSLDAPTERFVAQLPSAGLSAGRHTLFARGSDSGGAGPSYARFVDVVAPGTTGRLEGVVRDANTAMLLDVPAQLRLGESGTVSLPGSGSSYALRVTPGSYDLSVSAAGYASTTVAGISLAAAQNLVQDVQLAPYCSIISDAASAGLGNFTVQAPWGLNTALYTSSPAAFTDSPSGNYAANANTALTLVPLDLRDISHVRMRFQSWCDTESGYDYGRVEISTDGSIWTEVWSCDGNASWVPAEVDLSALDNQSNARIRFRFTADGGVQRDGWTIDDIIIEGTGLICGGVPDSMFGDGFE
jgi:carboxypeptidase T